LPLGCWGDDSGGIDVAETQDPPPRRRGQNTAGRHAEAALQLHARPHTPQSAQAGRQAYS